MAETLEQKIQARQKNTNLTRQQAQDLAASIRGNPQGIQQLRRAGYNENDLNFIVLFESKGARTQRLENVRLSKSQLPLKQRSKFVRENITAVRITGEQAKQRAKLNLQSVQRQAGLQQRRDIETLKRKIENEERITIGDLRAAGLTNEQINQIGREQFKAREQARQEQAKRITSTELVSKVQPSSQKKSLDEIIGKRLINKVSSYTKEEQNRIKNAKNPLDIIKQIAIERKLIEKSNNQKINTFLRQSTIKPKNQNEINAINKSIDNVLNQQNNQLNLKNLAKDLNVSQIQLKNTAKDLFYYLLTTNKSTILTNAGKSSLYAAFKLIGSTVNFIINPKNKNEYNLAKDNIISLSIKGAFKYGLNNTPKAIIRDINNIIQKSIFITGSVYNFVRKHPLESAIIVSLAANTTASGFLKNPVARTTEAILILNTRGVIKLGENTLNKITRNLFRDVNRTKISLKQLNKLYGTNANIVRQNIILQQAIPKFEIQINKVKLQRQLSKIADLEKKKLNKLNSKKSTPKIQKQIKQVTEKVKVIRNSSKALKLNPETISKGLGTLFKQEIKKEIKEKSSILNIQGKKNLKEINVLRLQLDEVINFWKAFIKSNVKTDKKTIAIKRTTIQNEINFYELLRKTIDNKIIKIRKEGITSKYITYLTKELKDEIKKVEFKKQTIKLLVKLKEKIRKEQQLSAGSLETKNALNNDKKFQKALKLVEYTEKYLNELSLARLNSNLKKIKTQINSGQLVTKETKDLRISISKKGDLNNLPVLETTPYSRDLFSGRGGKLFTNKKGSLRLRVGSKKEIGISTKNFLKSFDNNIKKAKNINNRIKKDRQRYLNNPNKINLKNYQSNLKRFDKTFKNIKSFKKTYKKDIEKDLYKRNKVFSKLNKKARLELFKLISSLNIVTKLDSKLKQKIKAIEKIQNEINQNLNQDIIKIKKNNINKVKKPKIPIIKKPIITRTPKVPKIPPKKPVTPKIPPKPPIKPIEEIIKPPKRILRIRFKLPKGIQRKGIRDGYIIKIKKGSKIIKQTIKLLPRNRAINLMRTILDNTPQASGDIVKSGKTNIVDVKNTILDVKFRTKRSKKKSKVLTQVEKTKYRLDKPKEKRISKKPKRKNTKKKSKKVKVVKKKKKSSKKRSKKK